MPIMSEPQMPKIHAKKSKKGVYYRRNLSGKSTFGGGGHISGTSLKVTLAPWVFDPFLGYYNSKT